MMSGDFGYTSLTREGTGTEAAQITNDEAFEYRLEKIYRSTMFRSSAEFWLVAKNLRTGDEHRIRLDDVMNESQLPTPPTVYGRNVFWSTMQIAGETEQIYLLTTTSSYSPGRRWVFEVNMKTQTVSLLEQIHISIFVRTEDDNYIAELYMVNFFDGENRSVRLVMTDTKTREEIHIPIEIDAAEIDFDMYLAQPVRQVADITPTGIQRIYYVVLREGFVANERIFELDMNKGEKRWIK
jgi:hypothetical protein